jgi:hypothetical protein
MFVVINSNALCETTIKLHYIGSTKNADRFKATDMVEEIQRYQQIWENLWKEWYYTALYSWHSVTGLGDQETGDFRSANRETQGYVGIHRTRLNDLNLQNST